MPERSISEVKDPAAREAFIRLIERNDELDKRLSQHLAACRVINGVTALIASAALGIVVIVLRKALGL